MSTVNKVGREAADFDPLRNADLFGDASEAPAPKVGKVRVLAQDVDADGGEQREVVQDLFKTGAAAKRSDLFGDDLDFEPPAPVAKPKPAAPPAAAAAAASKAATKPPAAAPATALPSVGITAGPTPSSAAPPTRKPHPPETPPPPKAKPPPPKTPPPGQAQAANEPNLFGAPATAEEEEDLFGGPSAGGAASAASGPVKKPTRNLFSDDNEQEEERDYADVYVPSGAMEGRNEKLNRDEVDKDLLAVDAEQETLAKIEARVSGNQKGKDTKVLQERGGRDNAAGDALDDDLFSMADAGKKQGGIDDSFDFSSYIKQNARNDTNAGLFSKGGDED